MIRMDVRATLEAAKTLLGKSYLYQQKFTDAKSLFKDVIGSGKYDLEDDINIFYHTAGNGSKEYVLECTRHYDTANMYAQGAGMVFWLTGRLVMGL